jgi:uncharacterized protein (DUF1330 family)
MANSPHYMMVLCGIDPSKTAEFTHYVTHARPIFGANGGRPVGQYATEATIVGDGVGDGETTHVIVMEFPSEEAIRAVFADPAYQALIPARAAAFPRLQILISKDFDPRSMLAVSP